jgi:hypothetical protein
MKNYIYFFTVIAAVIFLLPSAFAIPTIPLVQGSNGFYKLDGNLTFEGSTAALNSGNWTSTSECDIDGAGNMRCQNSEGQQYNHRVFTNEEGTWSVEVKLQISSLSTNNALMSFNENNVSQNRDLELISKEGGDIPHIRVVDLAQSFCSFDGVVDGLWHRWKFTIYDNDSIQVWIDDQNNCSANIGGASTNVGGDYFFPSIDPDFAGSFSLDNLTFYNGTEYPASTGGGAIPNILTYNMTSEGGEGCTNWNTDKSNACTTSDTTPTIAITTDETAYCAIGIEDLNYTGLGESGGCIGGGSQVHTCTLNAEDVLTQETSFVYIGCKASVGGFENSSSTSGSLKISILTSDLERYGRDAIESGIENALGSGYTLYSDQKLYARNSANDQGVGVFDKIVKWMNKIWAFNFLTGNDTATNLFNISPVLYVLEMTNTTNSSVNLTVYNLILDTK